MLDVTSKNHNPILERMVNIINQRTGNMDQPYFRTVAVHTLVSMASAMRTYVLSHDGQKVPVNSYSIALASSGYAKGHSLGILENELASGFITQFTESFLPMLAEEKLATIANQRSSRNASDPDEEMEKVRKEYDSCGAYLYDFPEGTAPALKQMRHKLLMVDAGALNFTMDELGYNIQANADLLKVYLELYDMGRVKDKLIKNSKDNSRVTPMRGITPANLLMFGVPTALFDGGKVEDDFYSFLESGYGRRTFFAYGSKEVDLSMSVDEMYKKMTDSASNQDVVKLHSRFTQLVSRSNYNQIITMSPEVAKLFLSYKRQCILTASHMPEHEAIRCSEMQHREFKAKKLAGAFAWHEGNSEISVDNFWEAIKFTEESGQSFQKIMVRERNYEKLARYLANTSREVTLVDLMEDLPFFKGSQSRLQEMIQHAIAYGHPRHIVIKKTYQDGIEFISGETLQETNIDKLIFSHSDDWTTGYKNQEIPFSRLSELTQIKHPQGKDYNWINHHLKDGYRTDDNAIKGFNMIILDVDGEIQMEHVKEMFKDYTYHMYTTKSHTVDVNRFRVVLPISHIIKLTKTDFKQFMNNVFDWMPWDLKDRASNQIAKKWLTNKGNWFQHEGEMLDARQFIPATRKNEDRINSLKGLASLSKIERWFAVRCVEGQRSNELVKYGLMLVDCNIPLTEIQKAIYDLNDKLKEPLDRAEIDSTILRTVASKVGAP